MLQALGKRSRGSQQAHHSASTDSESESDGENDAESDAESDGESADDADETTDEESEDEVDDDERSGMRRDRSTVLFMVAEDDDDMVRWKEQIVERAMARFRQPVNIEQLIYGSSQPSFQSMDIGADSDDASDGADTPDDGGPIHHPYAHCLQTRCFGRSRGVVMRWILPGGFHQKAS